jgi:hypothetical protein
VRVPVSYEVVDHSAQKPIHLIGTPGSLSGRLRLNNAGPDKAVLRAALLRTAEQVAGEKRAAARGPAIAIEGTAQITAVLRPGQSADVPVRARIDPHTPPGEHQATLVLGAFSYPAILHVEETIDFSMSPDRVLVDNLPGSRAHKRVTFVNHGNVPLRIGRIGAVPLDDEMAVCRTIRATLANAGKSETFNEWFTAYLREGKKQLEKSGLLWVEADSGPIDIAPGATVPVDFMVRIPDTLDPGGRYLAIANIYDSNLHFQLVPTGDTRPSRPVPDAPTRSEGTREPPGDKVARPDKGGRRK